MKDKPKLIKYIILSWVICLFFLTVHLLNYIINCFIIKYIGLESISTIWINLFFTLFSIIIALYIIHRIYKINKWSWLLNVIFSFYFGFHYSVNFLYSLIIFYLDIYDNQQFLFSNPIHTLWTASNFIIPFIMLFIFILMFRNEVKNYFDTPRHNYERKT